jgi:hypothetical protein
VREKEKAEQERQGRIGSEDQPTKPDRDEIMRLSLAYVNSFFKSAQVGQFKIRQNISSDQLNYSDFVGV